MTAKRRQKGFSLVEVSVAMAILGIITASVVVVMNRIIGTVIDWQARMEAFEICRENMESILMQSSATDTIEFGISETNPDISWSKKIESFYEPVTKKMWMRAVCSAEYFDVNGEKQQIELAHWLNSVSKKQMLKILKQQNAQSSYENQLKAFLESGGDISSLDTDELADLGIDVDEILSESENDNPTGPDVDPEVKQWEEVGSVIGPPPEEYEHWGQAPDDVFWEAVGKYLNSK